MQLKQLKWCVSGAMIIILFILASATILEKLYSTEWVLQYIYGGWWFVALWIFLSVASVFYIIRAKLYRRKAVFLLHAAFIVILLGALVTYSTAERGYLHIRQGDTLNAFISEDNNERKSLPFDIKLVLFDIEYHPGTDEPADYISFIKVGEDIQRVSMNKIYKCDGYRLYQMSYDPDEMGSLFMVNHDPLGIGITYLGYLLLAVSIFWLLWLKIRWQGMVYTFIPVALCWYYISQMNPMTPVLRSPLLAAHVSVIMISYALFIIMAIAGIVGLCSKKRCERMYQLNRSFLYPALFLLALGIFIGAVWANISWGRYWGWDAKETWALITLLIYAIPFHRQSLPVFRKPYAFNLYCVVALLAVAMTFFGVTFFLGGIHSYV